MITPKTHLINNSGVQVTFGHTAAGKSDLTSGILEDLNDSGEATPIEIVSAVILRKVIEWCGHHRNERSLAGDEIDSRHKPSDIEEWHQKTMTFHKRDNWDEELGEPIPEERDRSLDIREALRRAPFKTIFTQFLIYFTICLVAVAYSAHQNREAYK
ncbi:S-phase kinase-associated protein 1A [Penicillium herquei]|nr:S-phase kinase-associated protein 1A [Penicillium herquei]